LIGSSTMVIQPDPDQEDREGIPVRWRGQDEKGRNIITKADESIIEYKTGSKRFCGEFVIESRSKGYPRGDLVWIRWMRQYFIG
jgi:hypothetical protein